MAGKRRGLQKDVSTIFTGVALQDIVHHGLGQASSPAPGTARAKSDSTASTTPRVQTETPIPDSQPAATEAEAQEPTPVASVKEAEVSSAVQGLAEAPAAVEDLDLDENAKALMASVPCTRDFTCVRSKLADLCKARLARDGKVLQCLERKMHACSFRLSFLFKKICRCPMRQYIAKRWGR